MRIPVSTDNTTHNSTKYRPNMAQQIDNSGFCKSNSTFYSKRSPVFLPQNPFLDLTTFISSQTHAGTIAYIDASTGQHLTFPQVWQAVDSLSAYLSNSGIRKGNIVLILSPNSIYFPIICLSIMSLGAIITTTNPLNTTQEISKQIADSKPVLAFTTHSLLPKLSLSNLSIILIDDYTCDNQNQNSKVMSCLPEILKQKQMNQPRLRERVDQDDTASLLYSSGTTGASKGVISSHRNLIAMVQAIMQQFRSPDKIETSICTIPMFHIFGLAVFACGLLASGFTTVILSRYDQDEMLRSVEKYRATYLPVVPPILIGIINNGEMIKQKYDLSSLEWVVSGGAAVGKEVTEGFLEMYPTVNMGRGYGLTETAGICAVTNTTEECRRYGTVGLLAAGLEARIVEQESGEGMGVNKRGELWLRGPTVMKGYFNNPEATASTLDNEGWLRTGDLCYIDDDGYLFVVDRLKELIKYKGYQVPPAELEALLLSHPEITDAAVIPFPDKDVGQYPMAYVVRNAGSNLSDIEIMDFVAKQVASYKRIRRVSFVSTIPKNPSGKILRKDLIKLAASHL